MRLPQIITSLLDTDLYKFNMDQVIFHKHTDLVGEYLFKCRNKGIVFTKEMLEEINEQIDALCTLSFQKEELDYLRSIRFLKEDYIQFLRLYHPIRDYVTTSLDDKGELHISIKGPLFSAITRLSAQKGVERIMDIFPHLEEKNARLIVIGTGEMEEQFLYKSLPFKNVYFVKRYDEELAHLLYAASDFFLMPSYFEPCGTSQLISMRYGTLPIVSDVGGLNDTVRDVSLGEGANGFTFYNTDYFGCVNAYYRACDLYWAKKMQPLIDVGMHGDYSWAKSAKEYLALYRSIDWK